MRMSDPDFWNSPDTAKAVSQEATKLKEEVQGHDDLVNEAADLSELYDLAAEDEDTSFTGEIERQYYQLVKELEKREVLLLLSGEYDSCNASPGLDANDCAYVQSMGGTTRVHYSYDRLSAR